MFLKLFIFSIILPLIHSETCYLTLKNSNFSKLETSESIKKCLEDRSILDPPALPHQPKVFPVGKLPLGKYRVGTSPENEPNFPKWFDRDLAMKGKKFAQNYFFQIFYALSISMILQASSLVGLRRIFAFTGKTMTPEGAAKRFTANFLQMKLWYDTEGFDDNEYFQQSLLTVRAIHETVAYKAEKNKTFNIEKPVVIRPKGHKNSRMWRAFFKDIRRSKIKERFPLANYSKLEGGRSQIKFNQFDMSGGLWTFMCPPIIMPEAFDIENASTEDLLGFVHLWAGISYMLGIENNFNVASHKDLLDAQFYCRMIYEMTILPNMFNIDYEGQIGVERVIDGIMGIVPQLNTREGYFLKMLEDIVGIPAWHVRRTIGLQGGVVRPLERLILKPMLKTPFGQSTMNDQMRTWLKEASMKYFGFDGTDLEDIANRGYYY